MDDFFFFLSRDVSLPGEMPYDSQPWLARLAPLIPGTDRPPNKMLPSYYRPNDRQHRPTRKEEFNYEYAAFGPVQCALHRPEALATCFHAAASTPENASSRAGLACAPNSHRRWRTPMQANSKGRTRSVTPFLCFLCALTSFQL